jgi:sugar O-acyltransferase (sialic acid O-acetyltransferase NeuD family)
MDNRFQNSVSYVDQPLNIWIFGAGRHGKVINDLILHIPGYKVIAFIDDDVNKQSSSFCGYKVVGIQTFLKEQKTGNSGMVISISDNLQRKRVYETCRKYNIKLPNIIHPSAVLSENVKFEDGIQILPLAVVNVDAYIGSNSIIHTGAVIDHDCRVERNVSIWPGAKLTGGVRIGENSYVGTNATIIPDVVVGKNVIIGAGSVVIRNIPDDVVVVGVPAKIVKTNLSKRTLEG